MNNYVPTPLLVCEVIQEAQKKKKKEAKIKVLKDNESWALKDFLRGSYDDTVKWNVPGSKPPYTPNIGQSSPSNFLKLNTQLKYFVSGGQGDAMQKAKREQLFIQLLESIDPEDAELLCGMICKKEITGVKRNVVEEAFPGLLLDSQ
jgi:hypothetical protein|tara:strand:+ start:1298 stop:1738 length:441 start_codon:yes stop_codon:yes gene_type:complete